METLVELPPANTTVEPTDECARLLEEMGPEVESLLERMPANKLEARRFITRELGMEPRAEELQTMVRMAADGGASGPRRLLPRRLLALRLLADRQRREFFDTKQLEPETIQRVGSVIPGLIRAARRLEDELREAFQEQGTVSLEDRDFLLQVGEALKVPIEPLIAAATLAPRLTFLARAAETGNLRDVVSDLNEKELAGFHAAVQQHGADNPVGRVGLDALTIRLIMEDHTSQWERMGIVDEARRKEVREALIDRLRADKTTYHFVSDRLQQQQDAALVADLADFAQDLQRISKQLFSTYLKFAPCLREAVSGDSDAAANDERVAQLLEECASAEAATPPKIKEQLFLDALKAAKKKDPETGTAVEPARLAAGQEEYARDGKRLSRLVAVACLLLVTSVAYQFYRQRTLQETAALRTNLADYAEVMELSSAIPIGKVLYAQATDWGELGGRQQQLSAVFRLGRLASSKGFTSVHLVDGTGEKVASWDTAGGARLVAAPVAEIAGPPES